MRRTLSKMAVVLIGLTVPFALGSAAASAYGPAPGATITVSVSQAANGVVTLSVTGAGFGSNERVDFTVYNPPLSAGSTMTTAGGTLNTSIVLPAGLSSGSHTLIASGTVSGKAASATFVLAHTSGATQPCVAAAVTSTSGIIEADAILTASCRSQVPASGGTQSSGSGFTGGASSSGGFSSGGFSSGATPAATPATAQSSGGLAFTGTDATALVATAAAALALGGMLVLSSRRRQHSNWG